MTDLEISKALALAIGWERAETCTSLFSDSPDITEVWVRQRHYDSIWRIFDHRDWAVAGPIAAKYNAFPLRVFGSAGADWSCKWACGQYVAVYADTPQKAIALAVIGAWK
jgi:hypothetical protein